MTISVLFLAGRLLLAVPFVLLGVERLVAPDAEGAERLWGLLGLVGAAGVVLGAWGDAAALVLGVAVVGTGFADVSEDAGAPASLRLVGLLGAAVVTGALYIAVGHALDLTLTDPVFDLDLR